MEKSVYVGAVTPEACEVPGAPRTRGLTENRFRHGSRIFAVGSWLCLDRVEQCRCFGHCGGVCRWNCACEDYEHEDCKAFVVRSTLSRVYTDLYRRNGMQRWLQERWTARGTLNWVTRHVKTASLLQSPATITTRSSAITSVYSGFRCSAAR
jgi:hypothetical protein